MCGYRIVRKDALMHFGIKGQKWGVRRYQNEDGTLTEEGRKRYLATNHGGFTAYGEGSLSVFNRTVEDTDKRFRNELNPRYDKYDFKDAKNAKAILAYAKEARDIWHEEYIKNLAKDIGTTKESLIGQQWLHELLRYDLYDADVDAMEKYIKENG